MHYVNVIIVSCLSFAVVIPYSSSGFRRKYDVEEDKSRLVFDNKKPDDRSSAQGEGTTNYSTNQSCEPLNLTTVEVECFYKEALVDCVSESSPVGTLLKGKCRPGYTSSNPPNTTCGPDAQWGANFSECTPDCGRPNPKVEKPLISYGVEATYGEHPWHVGIYFDSPQGLSQGCGGSIIAPHIVLTAAHCFYSGLGEITKAEDVKVAAGKYFRSWDTEETYIQRRDVQGVILPERYRGNELKHVNDIALLLLETPFEISEVVLPVCMDWSHKIHIGDGGVGKVLGWGLDETFKQSETLQSVTLPYLSNKDCESLTTQKSFLAYLTSDKFCAGYFNGTGVQQGDSGGGLCFSDSQGKYYVKGVVSNKQRGANSYALFTNVTFPPIEEWINDTLRWINRHSDSNSREECYLPSRDSWTLFDVEGCKEGETSNVCRGVVGAPVPQNTSLKYFCKEGFYLELQQERITCREGDWTPSPPSCQKFCPPLQHSTVDTECFLDSREVSCVHNVKKGTNAKFKCKEGYIKWEKETLTSVCNFQSWWTNPSPSCAPVCGKTSYSVDTPEVGPHSGPLKFEKRPWMVEIYLEHENGTYVNLCRGTLVTSITVVTAAHCVYDSNEGFPFPPTRLLVSYGKQKYNWNTSDYFQFDYDVSEVFVGPFYEGGTYFDLALLALTTATYTDYALAPVCYNRLVHDKEFSQVQYGSVSGWSEKKELTEMTILILDVHSCRQMYNNTESLSYIEDDMLCGILHKDGVNVVEENFVGGGLTWMSRDGFHFWGGTFTSLHPLHTELALFVNPVAHSSWFFRTLTLAAYNYLSENNNLQEAGLIND